MKKIGTYQDIGRDTYEPHIYEYQKRFIEFLNDMRPTNLFFEKSRIEDFKVKPLVKAMGLAKLSREQVNTIIGSSENSMWTGTTYLHID